MRRPLSAEMKKYLRDIVRGKNPSAAWCTINALASRGLTDTGGSLTYEGWKQAVVGLQLVEQCQLLGIKYECLRDLEFNRHPEYAAWCYYTSRGFSGAYCEGGPILLLIRAAALDVLAHNNTFGSRKDACSRFTEAQLTIHQERSALILDTIRSVDVTQVASGFEEIYASEMVREYYPGLSTEMMTALFLSLGPDRLAQITAAIMEDPYAYRAGWPDLTMTSSAGMLWLEVKTTDRLHLSQITTLHRMKPLLPGTVGVVQLV